MNPVPECTEYNMPGGHRQWYKILTTFSQVVWRFFLDFRVDQVQGRSQKKLMSEAMTMEDL